MSVVRDLAKVEGWVRLPLPAPVCYNSLMLFSIFSKITRRDIIKERMVNEESVYLYLLFPIAIAFLITFGGARLISHYAPQFFIPIVPDLHIHHYSYGFLVLAASGYLALANNTPRDTYLISLLHGFGLGLAFDEFGIWLRLTDDSAARFSYDGITILIGLFFLIISAEAGVSAWQRHILKKNPKKEAENRPQTAHIEAPVDPLTFKPESDTIEA